MLTMCPKSCDNCGPCEDKDKDCEYWKDEGFCTKRPDYMFRKCKVSCQICIPGRNISTPCAPTFIYIYIYQFVFLRCTLHCYYIIVFISFNWCIYSISECVNKYYSCDAWAAYGFCERLQGYMTKHCAKACNTCGKIVTTRKTTPKPTTQATTRATTQATTKPTTRATTKPTTQATTPKTTSEPQAITLPTKKFTGIGRVYIQLYMT